MNAFLVSIHTTLPARELAAHRRRLRSALRRAGVRLSTVRPGPDMPKRLATDARGSPVIVIDDRHGRPSSADWLADLWELCEGLGPTRRPRLIYTTAKFTAPGAAQAERHPVITAYVKRDARGAWVDSAATAARDLARSAAPTIAARETPTAASIPDAVGVSACFVECVRDIEQVMRRPYSMIVGDRGVGKLHLVRAAWRQSMGEAPIVVVPCASFFKDYYVGHTRRRVGGGREAVDQLAPFLEEAQNGLLILQDVEELPTAVQEELAVRLTSSASGPAGMARVAGVDRQGLAAYDLKVVATSTRPPEILERAGRLVPELAAKLRKRCVRVPSLAERGPADVELLCADLIHRITAARVADHAPALTAEATRALVAMCCSGGGASVSELMRTLEHAVRRCRGSEIGLHHLPRDLKASANGAEVATLDEVTAEAQRRAILAALDRTDGDVPAAARMLGRNRPALYRLMAKLRIKPGRD